MWLRLPCLVPLAVLLLSSRNENGKQGQESWFDNFRILPKEYEE